MRHAARQIAPQLAGQTQNLDRSPGPGDITDAVGRGLKLGIEASPQAEHIKSQPHTHRLFVARRASIGLARIRRCTLDSAHVKF
jgi:hypothetical protein